MRGIGGSVEQVSLVWTPKMLLFLSLFWREIEVTAAAQKAALDLLSSTKQEASSSPVVHDLAAVAIVVQL